MEWRNHIYLCPLISGVAWFSTLFPLLVIWLAEGRPVYPDQSNPYVAFISDIGAFHLKPLFIIGSCLTGTTYALAMAAVHFARYDERMWDRKHPPWKQAISLLAVVAGFVAGGCLVCLSIFDTFRHHETHRWLLLSTFLGIGVSALCTVSLYLQNPFTKGVALLRDRPFCTFCSAIVIVEVLLTIVFFACQWTDHMRVAGIFEWTITFGGVGYLLTLVGFTLPPAVDEKTFDDERTSLLQRPSS